MEIIKQKGLTNHTENIITSEEELLENLNNIKKQGFGIEREENEPRITCIAAPIFNPNADVTGAVSILATSIRTSEERINLLKDKLMEVGMKISERLGYKNN